MSITVPMWLRRLKSDLKVRFIQPVKCRLGRHWVADVLQHDASINHGMCMHCLAETPPREPRPADPIQAQWMADTKAALDEYLREQRILGGTTAEKPGETP